MSAKLAVEGLIERPREFGDDDLAALGGQIDDVATVVPGREGRAVRLASLLESVGVREGASHLTVVAESETFAASVPLDAVGDAVLVYRLGDAPLPERLGGPVRLLIPDAARCGRDEVDTCANVKFVETLRLDAGRGLDTRPTTRDEHAAIHAPEKS